MDMLRHSEWADTKLTLHLVSQIMGKLKLALAPQQPQWAHVTLPLTVRGFSTGPLFSGETLFEVEVDVFASVITVRIETDTTVTPLEIGTSIHTYYEAILEPLRAAGVTVTINPKSQEMRDTWWLDRDETPLACSNTRCGSKPCSSPRSGVGK